MAVGFTIQFDETTSVQIVKQMDILVRYFSEFAGEVVVRYHNSIQYGHAPAENVTKEHVELIDGHGQKLKSLDNVWS